MSSLLRRTARELREQQQFINNFADVLAQYTDERPEKQARDYLKYGKRNAFAKQFETDELTAIAEHITLNKELRRLARAAKKNEELAEAYYQQQQKLQKEKDEAAYQSNQHQQKPATVQRIELLNLASVALGQWLNLLNKRIEEVNRAIADSNRLIQRLDRHERNLVERRIPSALERWIQSVRQQFRQNHGQNNSPSQPGAEQRPSQPGQPQSLQPEPSAPFAPPPAFSPEAEVWQNLDPVVDQQIVDSMSRYIANGQLNSKNVDEFFAAPPYDDAEEQQLSAPPTADEIKKDSFTKHPAPSPTYSYTPYVIGEEEEENEEEDEEEKEPLTFAALIASIEGLSPLQQKMLFITLKHSYDSGKYGECQDLIEELQESKLRRKHSQVILGLQQREAQLLYGHQESVRQQSSSLETYNNDDLVVVSTNATALKESYTKISISQPINVHYPLVGQSIYSPKPKAVPTPAPRSDAEEEEYDDEQQKIKKLKFRNGKT